MVLRNNKSRTEFTFETKKQITRFVHPHAHAHVVIFTWGIYITDKNNWTIVGQCRYVFNTLFKHGRQCPPHCTFYRVDNYPSAATALLLYSGCATLSHLRTMPSWKQLAPLFYRYMPTNNRWLTGSTRMGNGFV